MKEELRRLADMGYGMVRDFEPRNIISRTPISFLGGSEIRGVNRLILLGLNKETQHEYFDKNEIEKKGIIPKEGKKPFFIYEYTGGGDLSALPMWPLAFAANAKLFEHYRFYFSERNENTTEAIFRSFLFNTRCPTVTIDSGSHLGEGASPRIHLGKEIQGSCFDCNIATVLSGLIHWARCHPGIIQHYPPGHKIVSENVAYENLVAEIGGAFLAANLNIKYEPAYHKWNTGWTDLVKQVPEILEAAATEAQIAVDFLENLAYDQMADEAKLETQES